jgi:hypothetical protein
MNPYDIPWSDFYVELAKPGNWAKVWREGEKMTSVRLTKVNNCLKAYTPIVQKISEQFDADIVLNVDYTTDDFVISVRRPKREGRFGIYEQARLPYWSLGDPMLFEMLVRKFVKYKPYAEKSDGKSISGEDLKKAREQILPALVGYNKDVEFDIRIDFFSGELVVLGLNQGNRKIAMYKIWPENIHDAHNEIKKGVAQILPQLVEQATIR